MSDLIRDAAERLLQTWDKHGGKWGTLHEDTLFNAVEDFRTVITTHNNNLDNSIDTPDVVKVTDPSQISDGYHTFAELYEHRHSLMLALMRALPELCWFSQRHSDGELPFGSPDWFLVGADLPTGAISYHMPIELLPLAQQTGASELTVGSTWDGHTANDVIQRLRAWAVLPQTEPPADDPTLSDDVLKAAYRDAFRSTSMAGAEASWLAGLRAVASLRDVSYFEPISLSERSPEAKHCDREGRCWCYGVGEDMVGWTYQQPCDFSYYNATHWCPFYFLPHPHCRTVVHPVSVSERLNGQLTNWHRQY